MKLNLQIVTIEKKIYDEKVDSVVLPTPLGEAGVFPGHVPIVTSLSEGEIRIEKEKKTEYLSCSGGFAQIHPDKVVVLADAAEHADKIDIQRAEEAKKRAQETMKKADVKKEDYGISAAALRRSLMRIRVARRGKHRTKHSLNLESDNQ